MGRQLPLYSVPQDKGHELSRFNSILCFHCSPFRKLTQSACVVKEPLSSYLLMHFHFGQTFLAPAFQGVSHTTGGGSFLEAFLWSFFCNPVMWSCGNPGFLTAQESTQLRGCQINPVSVTSSFIFVVKEEKDQDLVKGIY